MPNPTRFFPGFHREGLGRRPASELEKMAKARSRLDGLCIQHLEALFLNCIPDSHLSFKAKSGPNSRNRYFTVAITFWAFLAQVLDPEGSCRRALARAAALALSQGLESPDEDTAAYCRARARLPVKFLRRIFRALAAAAMRCLPAPAHHRRLLVIDATALTLQDTPENRSVYSYANGQKKGCGFPTMKVLGLFDLRSGACLHTVRCADAAHDSVLAERILFLLHPGDIVLADRAFCSYYFMAKLKAKGVDLVSRLHQARARKLEPKTQKARKQAQREPVKPEDRGETWSRPKQDTRPMPETLKVRIITLGVEMRGHRPKAVHFCTTLCDGASHSAEQIAALYARRWEVELFFDDLKTSQKMDFLRTKSPKVVGRELIMHLIAYNLVRLLMAQAEMKREPKAKGRLSYRGTVDRVSTWHTAFWSCGGSRRKLANVGDELLKCIATDAVPQRPGRREPRVVKRRPKNFKRMTRPRTILRAQPEPEKRSRSRAA
jgi:hypothetical protein